MAAIISVAVLVLLQIITFAYGYGKLSQKVDSNKSVVVTKIDHVSKELDNHIQYTKGNGRELATLGVRVKHLESGAGGGYVPSP